MAGLAFLVLAFFPFGTQRGTVAIAAGLDVEIDGIKGPLEMNVETLLGIKRYSTQKDVSESRVRHLHGLAPEEIGKALEPFGYYHSKVTGTLALEGDEWKAAYQVDPGEPALLDTVDVRIEGDGANDPLLRGLVETFPLKVGDPVRHADWELGKASISGQAHVRGYLDGKMVKNEIVVDPDRNAARLTFVYETGPRYEFGPVRFEQDVLEQRYLDGYVTFEEGDSLDYDKLRGFQNTLRSTNYFKRVEVDARKDEAEGLRVPVDVMLDKSRPYKLDFGVSYGTDEGFGGTASVLARRVNRRGHRADAQFKVAETKQSAMVNYRIPWADPPTTVLSFSGGYERDNTESRESETILLATSLSRLRGPWQETLALSNRNETYEVGPDFGRTSLFGPDLQWSLIRADNRVFTRRGFRIRAGVQGAVDGILSSASFAQINLDGKIIRGGKTPHRVMARAKLGHTITHEFRELPASIRYFAGGAQSIRGYGYETLTPRDPLGQPIGGQSLIETSLEYDYRLLPSWAAAAFFDLGSAVSELSDPLSQGAGIGIRWLSPVGMIRLDYAWGLSREGAPTEVHFMIGPDL
ncbi:MAG: autotransporter assembly complex protein TamA [Candidatus Eiseniibacteriota bacterium]